MSQAYRSLFDYATRAGLLDGAPEFGQQIRKLEAFAKRSGEYGAKTPEKSESSDSGTGSRDLQPKASRFPHTAVTPPSTQHQQQQQQHLWGGIVVHQEPSITAKNHGVHSQGPAGLPISDGQSATHLGYEVIAQPTIQNASFPQSVAYGQHNGFTHPAWMPVPVPWSSLPHPQTYAFQEMTFGRRLQRTAIQRAAQLITMKHPPPDKLTRVFGFARLFETYEEIKERTLACVGLTIDDDLSNWKYPFHTLGGAGTHFPDLHTRAPEVRTDGRVSPPSHTSQHSMRPREIAPFTVGPFDMRTNKIREHLVGLGTQINLPGWDGVFWDPDEVDYYLLQNGVSIPALADHWVVELEDGMFGGTLETPTQPHTQAVSNGLSSASSAGVQSTTATLRPASTASTSTNISKSDTHTQEMWQSQQRSTGAGILAHAFTQAATDPALTAFKEGIPTSFADSPLIPLPSNNNDPSLLRSGAAYHGISNLGQPAVPQKRTWRIDVEKLLDGTYLHRRTHGPWSKTNPLVELISKATCLGRTPGFKPKDVDAAFWASVVVSDSF